MSYHQTPATGDAARFGVGADEPGRQASRVVEFISFAIDEDLYGVEITAVREIKGWSGVTHLPKQPEYMRGVLNLRGVMVPIIDLRCRFGQGITDATTMHVVIIVQIGDRQIGLLADGVRDIVSFETDKIQPVPRVARGSHADFLSGLATFDQGMIALIELGNILPVEATADQAA